MANVYRDPRNDHRVDAAVERVIMRADATCAALRELHELLDHEIELTPKQVDRMGRAIGHVAVGAGHLIVADLELTHEREDDELDADTESRVH